MSAGIWVFFFIGLSRLVEMSTGLNNNMIYYSPHYRYSLISLSIAAVLTMTLNIILIPLIGSVGAAIATLVSISFYNCFSVWLVWLKFRLFPFTKETLLAIGLSLVAFSAAYFIPYTGVDLLDILLRGGVFALVFGFFILRLRVSLDLNTLWDMLVKRYIP